MTAVEMEPRSFCCVVTARPWFDELRVYIFEFEARPLGCAGEAGLGCLQELLVIAIREVRLVVRAARFVTQKGTLNDDAREFEHVVELARERKTCIGPLRAIGEAHVLETFEQFHDLLVGLLETLV